MKKVLSIGNCSYDDSRIGRMLQGVGAAADRARDAEDAKAKLQNGDYGLVLINRVFDANGASGIEFVTQLKKDHPDLKIMLISDYPEAQATAVVAGALQGFGKSELSNPDTHAKVKEALGE